jgi:segregation and condensation protein A
MLPRPPAPPARPDPEAPDPEEALRERLLLYRAYRDAGRLLAERLGSAAASYHREPSAAAASAASGARPPREKPLDPRSLVRALSRSLALVAPPPTPPAVVPRTVTLAEQAAVVRAALADAPAVVLQDLLHGVTDRVVLAVTFLAVLELSKRQELDVTQDEPWGPIVCRARGA